ncbi:hypothetical protein Lfu02_72540 [Longispora fulva]|uniref:Glycosyl hydrolases family 39 N-terminal catalytic domain-containing protein n=1 Tax=Longispora fulva TaxID=619741 RepID=A0A8J7GLN4_9ACTN|nr:glycosyl hydrolase [Longispora fulva]MBG6133843.1 hypothetical protein [Longispora fulva]GIG62882.1 hypothetical protein Lfu02_72540 [Longispora fulva]
MTQSHRRLAVTVACVAGLLIGQAATPAGAATPTATIAVNASAGLGTLNNASRYTNDTRSGFLQAPLSTGERDQVKNQFHTNTTRQFLDMGEIYDVDTGSYDLSLYDPYLTEASSFSDRLLLCTTSLWATGGPYTTPKGTLATPAVYGQVLTTALRDYKQRFPKIEYIEPWNEPNHPDHGAITAAQHYEYYKVAYAAVNTVNAELNPAVPLKVGGPATAGFNVDFVTDFLDLYKADTNPAKRMDFVSYHDYSLLNNPAGAAGQKSRVSTWLSDKGLNPATPVFVTEYGLYAGAATGTVTGTPAEDLRHDQLVQAAGMAAAGSYYMLSGMDAPFQWSLRHKTNDRKDMFVDGVDGVRTPYGHMVAMQAMLRTARVSSTVSPAADSQGVGLGALATSDSSGVAVMYWNYQAEAGAVAHNAQVTVTNLPASFAGKRIRIQRYLVDATHSDYPNDATQTSLQLVEDLTVSGTQVTRTPGLQPNAVGLMVLTPVP